MSRSPSGTRLSDPIAIPGEASRRRAQSTGTYVTRQHSDIVDDDVSLPPLEEESGSSSDDFQAEDSEDGSAPDVATPSQPLRSRGRSDSLPSLQTVSDSSDDEQAEEWAEESNSEESDHSEDEALEDLDNITDPDVLRAQLMARISISGRDLQLIVNSMFSPMGQAVDNDPKRAEVLLAGLETVSQDLLPRYEKLRKGDESSGDGCVICRDHFVSAPHSDSLADEAVIRLSEESSASSSVIIIAFPCPGRHLFHHDCLSPWLARKTTCPTCRFDIDPDSLTLRRSPPRQRGGPAEEPRAQTDCEWHPPRMSSLSEWIDDEENFREHGVRRKQEPVIVARYSKPAPSATTPAASGLASSSSRENQEHTDDEWTDEEEPLEAVIPTDELLAHLANTTQPGFPYLPARRSVVNRPQSATLPNNLQMQSAERRGIAMPYGLPTAATEEPSVSEDPGNIW